MNTEMYKKKFDQDGYFKIENFLNKNEISKVIEEINESSDVDVFKDKNNLIRRVERFYNKGEYLSLINNKFMKLINDILKLKVLIFKDKLNLKPPGGEGFKAHYDGVFFLKILKIIKKRDGMNMEIILLIFWLLLMTVMKKMEQ